MSSQTFMAGNPTISANVYNIDNLSKDYDEGRIQALRGVRLTIDTGEFIAILGPSGCGKSTLLNLIGTLEDASGGSFSYHGRAVDDDFDRAAYRSIEIGFVFQSFHLLSTFSAMENVQMPMLETGWSGKERVARARSLLSDMGLEKRLDQLPEKLSGGERQRVAIARSLANQPSVLLADEPTGNLDSESAAEVMAILTDIHKKRAMTVVMVTHDPLVAAHASREIRMKDGLVVSDSGSRAVDEKEGEGR